MDVFDIKQENPQPFKCGMSLLHLAARHGQSEAVRCLVESGADIYALDNMERTPLHSAVHGLIFRTNETDLESHEKYYEIFRILITRDRNIAGGQRIENIPGRTGYPLDELKRWKLGHKHIPMFESIISIKKNTGCEVEYCEHSTPKQLKRHQTIWKEIMSLMGSYKSSDNASSASTNFKSINYRSL